MSITTTQATGTAGAATAAAAAKSTAEPLPESRSAIAADFQTFLKLLTTQMKSQDPLNPMESTEFVAELAQFSSVEQQIATNTTLTAILEAVTAESTGSLAQWLGQEVRAVAPVRYQGEPVEVYPAPATIAAQNATLVVTNAEGDVVAEQAFPPDAAVVMWDGKLKSGGEAPAGVYTMAVRYSTVQGETETADAAVYARVTEARREDGKTVLLLDGGGSVETGAVTGARPARTTVGAS